ncbi:MAG: DNA-processing protein DprA [Spirochaetes bacterium]|nr:DNA-processing protein DprA [Spirochaetota bacterium]
MDKKIYAVAVSLMSSGLWHFYAKYQPEIIYNECVSAHEQKVQEYYSQWYSKSPLEEAQTIVELCNKMNVKMITYWDDEYPCLLKEIVYPPAVLYLRGIMPKNMCLAIVGTRNEDTLSGSIAERLSGILAKYGITIVSGLAIGIDRRAHIGALKSGGSTIGVMANGIDMLYPSSNRDVYTDIINSGNGCVLSEYPPKARISKWTFVRRNRIVSGLSQGVIVIKAGEKSGALITARYALEQNRELFVCPGHSFDEGYKGCYMLLKEGAHPVYNEQDIFEVLNVDKINIEPTLFQNNQYRHVTTNVNLAVYNDDDIVKTLQHGSLDVDSLIRAVGKSSGEVLEKLTTMELEGIITRQGNIISLNK